MGDVSHISTEIIEGHREVKTFGNQKYEIDRFNKVNQRNRRQLMKNWQRKRSANLLFS